MAEKSEEVSMEEINPVVTASKVEEVENLSDSDLKDVGNQMSYQMPSPKHEEDTIKKKYGGLLPKKPPLISQDNERAFFDSADWALGKVGAQKSKGPLEALRPKLQPTPHHARSRSAYALASEESCNSDDLNPSENQDTTSDSNMECINPSENQNLQN